MNRDEVLAYLREQAAIAFQWGVTDCVQLAGGMLERATGSNPAKSFSYDSETSAKRIVAELGGLEAAVSGMLGPAKSDLRECSDGDIVLTAFQPEGHALGIAVPRHFYVRRVGGGLVPLDITLAIRFWPCRSF